jgi:basic membrane lipoprotein Med (substrate-binding protein (PBP1-ABC) superfamily)/DNA-binding SARP family transcriptional activator
VEVRLLGTIEVVLEGRQVDLGPRKQRALLCLLALHANRVVTTDRILEELWGDDAVGKENALWVAISRLRSALEPARDGHGESAMLLTRDHGYLLQVDPHSIDLTRFEAMVADARRLLHHDPAAAVDRVDAALSLWRGAPMEEFQHQEFVQLATATLEELRLEAVELRAEAELRVGRGREQVSALEVLHKQHPFRERFVDLLMRSLYQAGRQADALRVFDRYRRFIADELGISPAPELDRLEEQILLHDASLAINRKGLAGAVGASTANPFKGLRSFEEGDASDFFGRDRLQSEVIRRIEAGERLIALVGISGSGKSSVVKAGVLPALRKAAIEGSDRWLIAQMVPGSRPMLELEAALLRATFDPPDTLTEQLAAPQVGLLRAALRILPAGSRLLLVIDQFEELFALVDDENERAAFLDLLGPALDDPHGRITVLLTLRADFYDRPLSYPSFAERLDDGIVNVPSLTPDELERAAQEPMRQAHVAIEPSLLTALLTDVIGQPGALPLFQYTLTMLYDRRVDGVVTLESYRALGGLAGALAQRAEDLWARLDAPEQLAARQLFLRLVTITGRRDWSRRRVNASELTSLRQDLIATQRVIETFGAQRLLAFDRDHVSGSPTVEVAHEALLTEWPRLRAWIDEAGDDVIRHAALVTLLHEWRDAERSDGYLLAGQRLTDYEAWAERTTLDLTEHEREFLQRSITVRDDVDRGESERSNREIALAKRVRRRTGVLLVVIALIAAGGVTLGLLTRDQDLPTVAYIRSPGIAGSAGRLQDEAGWGQAQRDHDFDAVEVTAVSNPAQEMSALAEGGADVIVVHFDLFADVYDVAAAYPDTRFIAMAGFPVDVGLPNVTTVYPSDDEVGSFLAGAAAALTSTTGRVGYVGAHQPINERFRSGFEAGARASVPGIDVISTYLTQTGRGSVFVQPEAGALAARRLYEQGADVVFHAAGESGSLVPQVADTMSAELGRQLWVIGVDTDQYLVVTAAQREHVLTSFVKRGDIMMTLAVDRYFAGDLAAGLLGVGLPEGAIGLSTAGDHLSSGARTRIDALTDDIARGAIVVPAIPADPPTILAEAIAVARVTSSEGDCAVDVHEPITSGDIVRVEYFNSTDQAGSAQLFMDRFENDRVPEGWHGDVALPAAAHGDNAGVISATEPGIWTLVCFDADDGQAGAGTSFEIRVTPPNRTGTVPGCIPACRSGRLVHPGPVPPGPYTTVNFFAGALTVTVDEGWEIGEDSTGWFDLLHADGTHIAVWLDVYPVKGCKAPECPLSEYGARVTEVGPDAAALSEWLQANPNLTVVKNEGLVVDGIPFESFDVAVAADGINDDPGCPAKPCVSIFGFPEWLFPAALAMTSHQRLYLADVEYGGQKHLMVIATDGPGNTEAVAEQTEPVLNTLQIPAISS